MSIIMIVSWVLFAPTHFGGKAAYVVLSGNSMQPEFALGDLVITHKQANYAIGDALAYQHPTIGYVFHRIVNKDDEGNFILQGDNNGWEDSYHPSEDDIIGKLWWHLPKLGKKLESLRSPFTFSILSLFFAFLFFTYIIKPQEKKKRKEGNSVVHDFG